MKRDIYQELRKQFLEDENRLLIYGLPSVGKSYLLRKMTEENSLKNYVLCDLQIDKEFRDILKNGLESGITFCQCICEYFSMDMDFVLNRFYILLDGLECLEYTAQKIFMCDLPKHIAFSTSRIDYLSQNELSHMNRLSVIPIHSCSLYEFLDAVNKEENEPYTEILKAHFKNGQPIPDIIEEEIDEYFHDYLLVGGFPEAILTYQNNRTNLTEIRHIQEQIYTNIIYRYSTSIPASLSQCKLYQLLDYIKQYASDNRGQFHPGHIRRGGQLKEYSEELSFLIDNLVLIPVYKDGKFYRYELSDCGLTRYAVNDYDCFYQLAQNDLLPEYFYQNYVYHELHRRGIIIHMQKGKGKYYEVFSSSSNVLLLNKCLNLQLENNPSENNVKNPVICSHLCTRQDSAKKCDHNIMYYYLEQTQF